MRWLEGNFDMQLFLLLTISLFSPLCLLPCCDLIGLIGQLTASLKSENFHMLRFHCRWMVVCKPCFSAVLTNTLDQWPLERLAAKVSSLHIPQLVCFTEVQCAWAMHWKQGMLRQCLQTWSCEDTAIQ
ncbi:uncharacterized protein LOC144657891 [Oculina patagonica]